MDGSSVRFTSFPRTDRPPNFTFLIHEAFKKHEVSIATEQRERHLTSNEVLRLVGPELVALGFEIESGKRNEQKIERPVFFGENGVPTLRFEVDAYHAEWKCGLEVEATRAIRGGAVFRDLIQALVMDQVDHLVIAVPNVVRWGKKATYRSQCYKEAIRTAEALFGHSRISFPYRLTVIGY